jgi:hypothetical protein
MSTPLPSSLELAQWPELAILHALHAALQATERALLAAHPELEEIELAGDLQALSPMACVADLLLTHLACIDGAINRYTAQLPRLGSPLSKDGDAF